MAMGASWRILRSGASRIPPRSDVAGGEHGPRGERSCAIGGARAETVRTTGEGVGFDGKTRRQLWSPL